MSDVIAIYRADAEEVAALWNSYCSELGVQLLRPLAPDDGGWDIAHLRDAGVTASADAELCVNVPACPYWPLPDGEVGLVISFRSRDWPRIQSIFEHLLRLPTQPVVAMLVDHSWEIVEENLVTHWLDAAPSKAIDAIEGNLRDFEIHAIQALRRDLLHPLDEWLAVCRERGYSLRPHGPYYILDVQWSRAGQRDTSRDRGQDRDPVTGLLMKEHLGARLEQHLETAVGTIIVVTLTAVEPNPGREYGPWCEALPLVAQALTSALAEGDTLTHYHTQRQFAIVKSGLSATDAPMELERLRILLAHLDGLQVKAEFASASWPENGRTAEDMWSGSGWDKLNLDEDDAVL